jgi:HK97 gp10 family phage protein
MAAEILFSSIDPDEVFRKIDAKAVTAIAIKVTSQAKDLAPVDKGLLRNSLMWKTSQASGLLEEGAPIDATVSADNEALVGSSVEYAVYQEFGTRFMAPKPFLRPAAALIGGAAVADIVKKIADEEMKGTLRETPVEQRIKFF